jgi:hypothetical protein
MWTASRGSNRKTRRLVSFVSPQKIDARTEAQNGIDIMIQYG